MSTRSSDGGQPLARCHGYAVVARDGPLGEVDTPLFPPEGGEPDYVIVIVTAEGPLRGRRPVVPGALVGAVDTFERRVHLRGSRVEIASLPEHLPLAARGQFEPEPRGQQIRGGTDASSAS